MEQVVERAAQDFAAFYDARPEEPAGEAGEASSVLVLTVDGKGVVMRKEDLRAAARRAAAKRQHKFAVG